MWPIKRKARQRRLEVRKSIPSGRAGYWRRFRQMGGGGASILAAGFLLCAVLIDSFPAYPLPYRLGQYIRSDIRARVDFRVPSQRAIREQVQRARLATPARFRADTELINSIVDRLSGLPAHLAATTQPARLQADFKARFALGDAKTIAAWRQYATSSKKAWFKRQLDGLRKALLSACIVPDTNVKVQREQRTARTVILLHPGGKTAMPISEMVGIGDKQRLVELVARLVGGLDQGIRPSVRSYLLGVFGAGGPLYTYDASATKAAIDQAIGAINDNPPSDEYTAGQVLVYQRSLGAGQRKPTGLTAAEIELLEHENAAYVTYEKEHHPWRRAGRLIGRSFVLMLMTVALCGYVVRYNRRIVTNHWRGLGLVAVLLAVLALSKLAVLSFGFNLYAATFALLFGAIIIDIAYDQRFALAMGVLLAMMVVMQLRQGFDMLIVLLTALAVSVSQLKEIRTRSKIIEATAVAAAVVFTTICAIGLSDDAPWRFVLIDGIWAGGSALAAGMVLQVMLPLIERTFGIATSLTLLEWCDASKPLLKRLATEAPGTWNHCLQLGAMCETAADAIGARGLLARVGAYYHDIGKINKPDYFVENQGDSPSKHDKLSPEMSLLIILGHVKDGVEMAREYGLPHVLHQFIATHHGTTLVQYFYHAATTQRKAETDRRPEEVEFRYPGPKPQTKETGILMLADAAESSVRAMSEPTPGRIENQVHTMVNRRLMDGQLDECEMTLREVHQVQASLVKSLCSIYHARISYPAAAGKTPSASETAVQPGQGGPAVAKPTGGGANGKAAP